MSLRCISLSYGFLMAAVSLLTACTGTTIRPETVRESVQHYGIIVVGDVSGKDELWKSYAVEMRRSLSTELGASKAFTQLVDPAPPTTLPDAVRVTAQITEVAKGSEAMRWIVGFGAGKAHMTAEFKLLDPAGAELGTFSLKKTYSGGLGIGGAGMVDMDDLANKLGKQAADAIVVWSKTGKIAAN